jgi:hypothetical protein
MEGGVITTHNPYAPFSESAMYMMHSMLAHEMYHNQQDEEKKTNPSQSSHTVESIFEKYSRPKNSQPQKKLTSDSLGSNLLRHAAKLKDNESLKNFAHYVATYSHEINSQDCFGNTPLHIAAQENNTGAVTILLKNKADQTIKNNEGCLPLALALAHKSFESSLLLIENKCPGIIFTTPVINKYDPEDPFHRFKNNNPKDECFIHNHQSAELLFDFTCQSEGEKVIENYEFITPIHSALLCQRLEPIHKQQTLAQLLISIFILKHYQHDTHGTLPKEVIHRLITAHINVSDFSITDYYLYAYFQPRNLKTS